jgi:hypothetical protein
MNYKSVPTNEVVVEVHPSYVGDLGGIVIGGMERSTEDEMRTAKEIEGQINRHVDDVGHTTVKAERMYETEDGSQYETEFEMLADQLEYDFGYEVRYERPSDNGVGTRTFPKSFNELIETAFENPYKFSVHKGDLNKEQQEFLSKVLEEGRNREFKWV